MQGEKIVYGSVGKQQCKQRDTEEKKFLKEGQGKCGRFYKRKKTYLETEVIAEMSDLKEACCSRVLWRSLRRASKGILGGLFWYWRKTKVIKKLRKTNEELK